MTNNLVSMITKALNLLLPNGTEIAIWSQEQTAPDGEPEQVYHINLTEIVVDNAPLPNIAMQVYFPLTCDYETIYEMLEQTIGTIVAQHLGFNSGTTGLIIGHAAAGVICYRFMVLPKDPQEWLSEYIPGAELVGMYLCDNTTHAIQAEETFRKLITYARNTLYDPRVFSDPEFLSVQAEAAVKGTRHAAKT